MSPDTHTAIAITAAKTLGAVTQPTRAPEPDQVQIKVHYASYGSPDAHALDDGFFVSSYPHILGLSAVGKVTAIGSNVTSLKEGDWAVAYTQPGGDRGLQEYITIAAHRAALIPPNTISPESATTVIDNFVCAWWTITNSFELPLPSSTAPELVPSSTSSSPILIWGAGTSASLYTIQLLRYAGYTNIIATASARTAPIAFNFGATHVFDYADPEVTSKILSVAGSEPIKYALDPVCTSESLKSIATIVTAPQSKVAVLIPIKKGQLTNLSEGGGELLADLPQELNPFDIGVDVVVTRTFVWESDTKLKDTLLIKIFPELLVAGKIKPQPVKLITEGSLLERVQTAAELVRSNKLGGAKAIIDFTV